MAKRISEIIMDEVVEHFSDKVYSHAKDKALSELLNKISKVEVVRASEDSWIRVSDLVNIIKQMKDGEN